MRHICPEANIQIWELKIISTGTGRRETLFVSAESYGRVESIGEDDERNDGELEE